MVTIYNQIGKRYSNTRKSDPRVLDSLVRLLDLPKDSRLLDIGAGTGNYSVSLADLGYAVTALEPSEVMRSQAVLHERVSWVAGCSEKLPFEDNVFDGAMMTLCMHHFSDWRRALKEAKRVQKRTNLVIFTFDAFRTEPFWLYRYFPDFLREDRSWFPRMEVIQAFCQDDMGCRVYAESFPIPNDSQDHFLSAGWSRPEIYLQESYRSGISSFSKRSERELKVGILSLEADLASGAWDARFGHMREQSELDTGYVFIRISEE